MVLALALFIVALVLVIVQSLTGGFSVKGIGTYSQGYSDGYNAARDTAMRLGLPGQDSTTIITGIVTEVSGNSVKLETAGMFLDKTVDGVGDIREVIVGSDTKFLIASAKTPSEYDIEMSAYNKTMRAFDRTLGEEAPAPPSLYNETDGSLSDIAVGDKIRVYSKEGEDILLKASFTAGNIIKMEAAVQEERVNNDLEMELSDDDLQDAEETE